MSPALVFRAALAAALFLAGAGCEKERARNEAPVAVPAPRASTRAAAPSMRVAVSDLVADPTVDPQGVRSTLRDAETSLLGCLDARSGTGSLVLSFAIENDDEVGSVVEGSRTTLADERTRRCIERLVGATRFSGATRSRAEVTVTLEVRPRRAVE